MMKKNIIKYLIICFTALIGACETTNLDLLDDPNNATADSGDTDLLLNGALVNFKNFMEVVHESPMQVVRMTHFYGPTYDNGVSPSNFDTEWSYAYASILADTRAVITGATDLELYDHAGVAKIIEAYTIMTLVDMFGDVPYSEAISYADNLNPALDDDADVYEAALALLNDALSDFEKTSVSTIDSDNDIYYGADISSWTTLAKTLKLRYYNNTRLVNSSSASEIEALIAEGDLIFSSDLDFQVEYGTSDNDPDTRHYKFTDSYDGGGEYIASYFLDLLYYGKSDPDPRIRYYFYRQTLEYPDASTDDGLFTLPCLAQSRPLHYSTSDPFCVIGDGYWGRDHMNDEGGVPDGDQITIWGLYPAGGRYDNNDGEAASISDGAKGAGINPIWNVAATYFVLAEASLELGTTGDPATYLEAAIRASFTKVLNFNTSSIPSDADTPTDAEIDAYVTEVMDEFSAGSDEEKLNIIMTEAMISHWGNGLEVYNGYRRTGYPDNLQPAITAEPGSFIRSFPYASNAVNRNQNISAKSSYAVQVFWDTNPAEFID